MKQCQRCKETKSDSDFCKNKRMKDGINPLCRACDNKKTRAHYKDNKKKICARTSNWAKENLDKTKAYRAKYYQNNKEKVKAWKDKNIDRIRIWQREYYTKNKVKIDAYTKQALKDKKSYIGKLKEVPCADCKQRYPSYVMDFDHLDPTKKKSAVSFMLSHNQPLKMILEEISKCEVVCANCHRERTHKQLKERAKMNLKTKADQFGGG